MPQDPPDDLHDEPLEMRTFSGAVVLTGPPGVALAMTVDAAERSAEMLEDAARVARRGEPDED
jgi:hypothetical protein